MSESKIELNVPWVISPNGFVSTLCASFTQAQLQARHLWSEVLRANELKLSLRMHYPREWNMPQTWDMDLDVNHSQLVVLFDYKRFFKGKSFTLFFMDLLMCNCYSGRLHFGCFCLDLF